MKILVVSQYFYPENFRINNLCLELKKRGHAVSVLTGKPNYPKGEYYNGYTFKGNEDEIWNNIPIYRVPLRARYRGSLNLVRNYFSFVYHANKKVKKIKEKYDLIYVFEVSPMTVALPAIKYKKIHSVPVIMNVQDLWPENIIAVTGINNPMINFFLNKLVNYIYNHVDLLLTSSPSFVPKIQSRINNKEKVKYWPQYSIVEKCEEEHNLLDNSKLNIVFTGNIGEAQGIDLAIEAARILKEKLIHWHFIGDGRQKEKLQNMAMEYGLDNTVTFYGFIPEQEIPYYLHDADAALLILKPNPIFEMTIPAKLQTYLACGVPILGCVSGEGKKIIIESNSGLVSDTVSVNSLVDVVNDFLNLSREDRNIFKQNALNYGKENFNKSVLLDQLDKYMEELL